jgi:hypothetical protein
LQPGGFLAVYRDNRDMANEAALDSSPMTKYVLQVAEAGGYHGTPSDLLAQIETMATDGDKRLKTWPHNPRSLSGTLKRLAPNLRVVGVEIEFGRDSGRQRKRLVTVTRTDPDSCVRTVRTVRNAGNDGVSADAADASGPVSDANTDANGIDVKPDGAVVRTQADGSDAEFQPSSNRVRVTI